ARPGALPDPASKELAVLRRIHAPPSVRLACQLRPRGAVEVTPLLPPYATAREAQMRPDYAHGREHGAAAEMSPVEVIRYISGCDVPAWQSRDAAIATMSAIPIADEITGYSMLYSMGTTRRSKGVKRHFLDEPIDTLN